VIWHLLVQEVRELRSEPFEAQVARINNYRERVSEGLRPELRDPLRGLSSL
jgi:hypothetical protein